MTGTVVIWPSPNAMRVIVCSEIREVVLRIGESIRIETARDRLVEIDLDPMGELPAGEPALAATAMFQDLTNPYEPWWDISPTGIRARVIWRYEGKKWTRHIEIVR